MKSKLAIVDARCDEEVFIRLGDFAEEVLPFRSERETYESVSCHPDIFLFQDKRHVVVAPNAPKQLSEKLLQTGIDHLAGCSEVGPLLRNSSSYNCVSTDTHLFHRRGFTEKTILSLNQEKTFVALPQSYTRCSMLALNQHTFITSDAGIHKVLQRQGFESFLFDPSEIRIAVHKNGFLGGTCGLWDGRILFLGNPLLHADGKELCRFIEKNELEPVALSEKKLYDGGGLFLL